MGNSTRHAPLGQVIADDENRSKYATVKSRQQHGGYNNNDGEIDHVNGNIGEEGLLDEKTSQRIFELGKEQLLEIEMEEQRERKEKQTRKNVSGNDERSKRRGDDSSDEEDDMDSSSIVGDNVEDEEE